VATAAGLSGLISQANSISNKLDPFHNYRNQDYLGVWFQCQETSSWWTVRKPPLYGPILHADLETGFNKHKELNLTRLDWKTRPPPGQAGWAVICAVIFPGRTDSGLYPTPTISTEEKMKSLDKMHLMRYSTHACVSLSRTALITMLLLTNARAAFSYGDASGFRAGYPSYYGQWYIDWPSGREALVRFSFHDYGWLKQSAKAYPESFLQRPDRCIQMGAGVIVASDFQLAFCGRKPPGTYVLEKITKGYSGAHGSRHLYSIMGGKVHEVDYLSARRVELSSNVREENSDNVNEEVTSGADEWLSSKPNEEISGHEHEDPFNKKDLELEVLSTDKEFLKPVIFRVPEHVRKEIEHALDCLPWNSLSWSIHRGMRDILLEYSKPIMNRFRRQLAELLKNSVLSQSTKQALIEKYWKEPFVSDNMGEMAASAVRLGGGDSGDSVRVVTDIMYVLFKGTRRSISLKDLDEVEFWRLPEKQRMVKDDLVWAVALTKVFVLEWSIEFDYQMYHNIPIYLKFA